MEGEGSTFWFSIPLLESKGKAQDKLDVSLLKGKRILMVDDTEAYLHIYGQQAKQWDMQVETADSYQTALELLHLSEKNAIHYDVIATDLNMPDKDGLELSAAIRQLQFYQQTPILLLTITGCLPDASVILSSGITAAYEKPAFASELAKYYIEALGGVSLANKVARKANHMSQHFPLRVLVAEDNPVNQMLINSLLLKYVDVCKVVENGALALTAIINSHHDFDLLLLDYEMPEMNGSDAAMAIRQLKKIRV